MGLAVLVSLSPGSATAATPRSAHIIRSLPLSAMLDANADLKAAYVKALGQYENLELDQALAGLDAALATASAEDPATAPLRMLRAVIIFSNTGKADKTSAAFVDAIKADYNIALPTALRSPDLQKILDKARKASGGKAIDEGLVHTSPDVADACGKDISFNARARLVPEGGQVAFYWRPAGSGEFKTAAMDIFGNLASLTLTASDHGDKPIEYFIYVFDAANKEQGNKGDSENPIKLDIVCIKDEPKPEPKPEPPPKPKNLLPKVFINIGLGAGLGLARGVADLSYQQYSPLSQGFAYGPAEYACSLARWQAGSGSVPGDAASFAAGLGGAAAAYGAPYSAAELAQVYDADKCGAHHPVKSGMAPAPFHIAPEIGFRIGRAIVLSGFARLQVVTGSKVYRDDPKLDLGTSYTQEVLGANPQGVRVKPGFTGAGGIKIKYFLGKDDTKKFRLFVGGMVGGGFARLRVPMGFANDRNGNSVPDDQESASDFDLLGNCQPVWPYSGGCTGKEPGAMLATGVATQADKSQRIDTVRIGGGFIGATFGFNYQIVKNFALFAEAQVSVWFPKTSSFLIDLNLGPVITF